MSFQHYVFAAALLSLSACQSSPATETAATDKPATETPVLLTGKTYGAAVNSEGAKPLSELNQVLGTQDSAQVKLIGKADAVCQAKGCWMTMKTPDGREMRVRFKDYAFFVPKDICRQKRGYQRLGAPGRSTCVGFAALRQRRW